MKKKERIEAKLQKMNVEFNELHRKAKHIKQDMAKLRAEYDNTPANVEERIDELIMKT